MKCDCGFVPKTETKNTESEFDVIVLLIVIVIRVRGHYSFAEVDK